MKKYIFYAMLLTLAACGSKEEEVKAEPIPQGPLAKSANPEVFNQSFEKALNDYYTLKDHFIAEKSADVDASAGILKASIDSVRLDALQADTSIIATARFFTQGISAELVGLMGEKDIEAKRKSFQMVGDQLYDLIRTVQYDRAVIYHQYCPMAFNDQGANWLSNSPVIRNPYLPKKMLSCGEVKDSIDFRPKP